MYSTQGIILHKMKYGETSLIVKIFTREKGLISFLIKGALRQKKSNSQILAPLVLVDVEAYRKDKTGLQIPKEIQLREPYTNIHTDIRKTAIALFISELLYRTIKEDDPSEALFNYLSSALQVLDQGEYNANYLPVFMLKLSAYFGFYPQRKTNEKQQFFDVLEGNFLEEKPHHLHYFDISTSEAMNALIGTNFDALKGLNLNPLERKKLLTGLLDYYYAHLEGMQKIKSRDVLESVFE